MQGFGQFPNLAAGGGNGAYFSSSVQSFSSSGNGAPVYYSRTSSTKMGPSGLLEKQETERDSSTGVERMSLHRQLGDRARTITREKNHNQGGQEVCHETLQGITQDEATSFDREWTSTAGNLYSHTPSRANRRSQPAIAFPNNETNAQPLPPMPHRSSQSYSSSQNRYAPTNSHSQPDLRSHPYTHTSTTRTTTHNNTNSGREGRRSNDSTRHDTRHAGYETPNLNSYGGSYR